jgi:CBS domain containing-hemolysin-like protein
LEPHSRNRSNNHSSTIAPASQSGDGHQRRRRSARLRRRLAAARTLVVPAVIPARPRRAAAFAGLAATAAIVGLLAFPLLQAPEPAAAQQPTPAASAATAVPSPAPSPAGDAADTSAGTPAREDAAPARPDGQLAALFGGLVLVLTLLNAAFSMAETALVSVRRSRVEQLIEEGQRGAKTVRRLIENPPRFIATVQVGITLLGFASAAAAATTLAAPLTYALWRAGLSAGVAGTVSVTLITVLIAVFSMIVGEIAPKSLAVQAPDRWALRLAPFVDVCATLFAPITSFVVAASNVLVRPFGAKAQFETPVVTKEELEHIIGEGAETGELDREEQTILENVFDFSETLVRSVMTPRIDMTALPVTADLPQTLDTVLSSGHSRIPVYEGTIDNVVGIVHAKDLLRALQSDNQSIDLRRVMRAPHYVPETKRVADLLAEMRRSNQQLAIVQDEYAGTEGLVTIEDLLEEIVGDIRDEYDVDEPEVQVLSPTESLIDGRMSIDDVNDRLGLELPHEDYETVGGLVFGLLGHEARPGERVRVDRHEFIVESVEGRRIKTIRALRAPEGTEASADAGNTGTGGDAPEPADTGANIAIGA